jgi:alcohol dehydrogenase
MKAAVITKYGPPEGLQLREVEKPTPKKDEVLVKIHATTVTFGDAMLRSFTGLRKLVFGLFFDLGRNKILGHELAGEVEEIGKDITRFRKDDQVLPLLERKGVLMLSTYVSLKTGW